MHSRNYIISIILSVFLITSGFTFLVADGVPAPPGFMLGGTIDDGSVTVTSPVVRILNNTTGEACLIIPASGKYAVYPADFPNFGLTRGDSITVYASKDSMSGTNSDIIPLDTSVLVHTIDVTLIQMTCPINYTIDHCDGSVDFTAVPTGVAPYVIDWDMDGNGTYEQLNGGISKTLDTGYGYTGTVKVRVTDTAGGILEVTSTEFTVNPELSVSVGVTTNCAHTESDLTATATGGDGSYTYSWVVTGTGTPSGTSTNVLTVSGAGASGTAEVTVTDGNGCTATATGDYDNNGTELGVSISTTYNCDGSVTFDALATGGGGSYTYQWDITIDSNNVTPTGASYTSAIGLYGSSYNASVTVTDACTTTANVTASGSIPDEFILSGITLTPSYCTGVLNATATVTGGVAPFDFEWSLDGITYVDGKQDTTDLQDTFSVSDTYDQTVTIYVRVTDSRGCVVLTDDSQYMYPQLVADMTVSVDQCASLATFTVNATGGNLAGASDYRYEWDMNGNGSLADAEDITIGGTNTVTLSGRGMTGTVIVHVIDANACVATDSISYLINSDISVVLSVAYGQNTAFFTATAYGGGGCSYHYDWNLDEEVGYEVVNGGSTQQIVGESGQEGTVCVLVTDECSPANSTGEVCINYKIPNNDGAIGSFLVVLNTTLSTLNNFNSELHAMMPNIDIALYEEQLEEIESLVEACSYGANYIHRATSLVKASELIEEILF